MIASRGLMFLALLSAAGFVNADPTHHKINASAIGAGVQRGLNWQDEALQLNVWCGTACSYQRVSSAKIAPDAYATFTPSSWLDSSFTSFPSLSQVVNYTSTPQGTVDSSGREIIYGSTSYERASMSSLGTPTLKALVYQSGNQPSGENGTAAAVTAYHSRVHNQSSGPRDYFVRFTAPKSVKAFEAAYYIGGPSGNQPINYTQQYAKARSAVDVLVNGMPVWSTSAGYFFPAEFDGGAYEGFTHTWGYASDNDMYTVFVGRFAADAQFTLDFIVRADSVARAPQCGKENEPLYYSNPRAFMHCFLLSEGRALAGTSSTPLYEVYSKTVSTGLVFVGDYF